VPCRRRRCGGVSVGDSYDNALMENFFSTLKIELVYRRSWRTRDEAENAIFAYIDGWYNTERIQKDLGWLSPDEYEAAWQARQDTQGRPAIVTPEPTGDRR
jgi:putative transposase